MAPPLEKNHPYSLYRTLQPFPLLTSNNIKKYLGRGLEPLRHEAFSYNQTHPRLFRVNVNPPNPLMTAM